MHFVRYQSFVDTYCLHLHDEATRWRQLEFACSTVRCHNPQDHILKMYLTLYNLIWKQYLCYIYEAKLWVLRSGHSPLDDVTEMRYFILRYCLVTQLRSEYL